MQSLITRSLKPSSKNILNGRAWEYALALAITSDASDLIHGDSNDLRSLAFFHHGEKDLYHRTAGRAINFLTQYEPALTSVSSVRFLADGEGKYGDVRDLVVTGVDGSVFGISGKSGSDTLKNPRLSPTIDFGKSWAGISVSQQYMQSISLIFTQLKQDSLRFKNFKDLPNKNKYYREIMTEFEKEFRRLCINQRNEFVPRVFDYLTGVKHDYYFINFRKSENIVHLKSFNVDGGLGWGKRVRRPSKLEFLSFKELSDTTVIAGFDGGWQFSFRIHNAERVVTMSMKLDVKLVGTPPGVYQNHLLVA